MNDTCCFAGLIAADAAVTRCWFIALLCCCSDGDNSRLLYLNVQAPVGCSSGRVLLLQLRRQCSACPQLQVGACAPGDVATVVGIIKVQTGEAAVGEQPSHPWGWQHGGRFCRRVHEQEK